MPTDRQNAHPSVLGKKSLEAQLSFQKKLMHIVNRIHSAVDTNDILVNLQGEILTLFDADRITVYAVDGSREKIVSKFKTGNEVAEIQVPIDKTSIAGYCVATGKMINVADVYDENELKRLDPDLQFDKSWDELTGYKTEQVLAAPIRFKKYVLGSVQLMNKRSGGSFSPEDQFSILNLAKVLGIAFFKNQQAVRQRKPTRYDDLITHNIVSTRDLREAMSRAREAQSTVESVLMRDFYVSKDDLGKSLSGFFKAPFIPYDDRLFIPEDLVKGLRKSYLKHNGFVPVATSGDKVVVAMENPHYLPARDAIRRILPGKKFEYCVSLREDIFQMIEKFCSAKRTGVSSGAETIEEILGQLQPPEKDVEEEMEAITEEHGAIVHFVNKMIIDAYDRGASDIHIEPRQGKEDARIRLRIDGDCQLYQSIPYTYKRAIVSRVKIMSDLDIAERRLPQDGKIKFKKFAPLDIELRVATIPTAGQNEDVVLRLLTANEPIPLEQMGMSERNYHAFIEMVSKPYGIVLVVGPTGSGKTTTLHAAMAHINKPEVKIWTAEDPVEITQDGLRQVQVQPKIGLDFARAMRSFLRADPDVIMVGEMRDRDTMSTGIEASLTGHLVLSTLHTNSAAETIVRLLDMGMDPFNFADALIGVLAQRLVRTLCRDCREEYHPGREEYDALARAYDGDLGALGFQYTSDLNLYRAKGCPWCNNSGYKGRMAIHELLVGSDEIKALIQSRAKIAVIRKQAIKEGMTTLMQDGIRKIFLGATDFIQVRKVSMK